MKNIILLVVFSAFSVSFAADALACRRCHGTCCIDDMASLKAQPESGRAAAEALSAEAKLRKDLSGISIANIAK